MSVVPDDEFDLILNKRLRFPEEDEFQQAQRYVDYAKEDLRSARLVRNAAERKVRDARAKVESMKELQRTVKAAHRKAGTA
jgi:hypothetical protein